MNCQKFEIVVNDIAREQIIDAGARVEALRHSDGCQHCAERLADERTITAQLRDLAESMKATGAPARVEARLLAAFSQRSEVRGQKSEGNDARAKFPSPLGPARSHARPYWAAAIAAALLLVSGLAAIRWQQSKPARRENGAALVVDAGSAFAISPATVSGATPVKSNVAQAAASRPRPSTKRPAKPETDSAANTEIATDFLPMGYGSTTNLQEGGQMVRVELPRSAMASFGLPVNMDRANEKVKADVLLGVDGLAHAIRFVR
jgi:hypothetical protein